MLLPNLFFGVCLGQQAIAEAFGGSLINLSEIYHGVATEAKQVKPHKILENLPEVLEVGAIILGR
jgi:anthranilate synthase component 2